MSARGDQTIYIDDVSAVFDDDDPHYSFIAHVRRRWQYESRSGRRFCRSLLIVYDVRESRRFSFEQFQAVSGMSNVDIPKDIIEASLRRLQVTSVVSESKANLYEFSVPDYPQILNRLEEIRHLAELEDEVAKMLKK